MVSGHGLLLLSVHSKDGLSPSLPQRQRGSGKEHSRRELGTGLGLGRGPSPFRPSSPVWVTKRPVGEVLPSSSFTRSIPGPSVAGEEPEFPRPASCTCFHQPLVGVHCTGVRPCVLCKPSTQSVLHGGGGERGELRDWLQGWCMGGHLAPFPSRGRGGHHLKLNIVCNELIMKNPRLGVPWRHSGNESN